MATASKIALFGGTFDPIHLGHLAMAEHACKALALDQVRFIPCHHSPHKKEAAPTPASERMRMVELATRDLPWAVVDGIETTRDGPSFSWVTAEAMRDRFPESTLYWIMGCDQWQALDRWAHPERIADCCEFIVFARDSRPQPRDGFRMHVLDEVHPASATEIRKALAEGASGHPWLPVAVAGWIRKRGLYAPQAGS